jgi:hypothetical protein
MALVTSSLYTVTPRTDKLPFFANFLSNVNQLKPGAFGGNIDVVNKFRWSNSVSDRTEVPSITLKEYELAYGTWFANLVRVAQGISDFATAGTLDPYVPLYSVTDADNGTGFYYRLPYLLGDGAKIRNIENTWSEFRGGIDNMFDKSGDGGFLNSVGQLAGWALGGTAPGVGFEDIYEFKNTNLESITVTFPLYNTVSLQEAKLNFDFVNLITFQNLKTRTSVLTFVPPKIYTVSTANCLGGLYWPVAVISNVSIESIGTTRELREFGSTPLLIPEAYKVSLTIRQLLPNSSNIFEGAIGGKKVNVFADSEPIANAFNLEQNVDGTIRSPIPNIPNPFPFRPQFGPETPPR